MQAVEPFHPQYVRAAQRVARREARLIGRAGPDVADLEQAAVLGLDDAARRWDPTRAEFSTWLGWRCRCAVRVELRRLRGPAPGARARAAADPGAHDPCSEADDARDTRRLLAAARRALRCFPAHAREMFMRHYRDGETCQALAAERGVTQQAISLRLRRMLVKVQAAACAELGYPLPGPRRSTTRNAKRCRARRRAA